MELLKRLVIEEDGQGITEYALILGFVVFGIWLLVQNSGIAEAVNGIFTDVKTTVEACDTSGCGAAAS